MRLVLLSALVLLPSVAANRTACFAYVDCFERAQVQLKECVGGTAVSLTVEAKDQSWTAADLVQSRGLLFNQCQDRLTRELVDFDTLQLLVQEDARECFEKLPASGKRASFNSGCGYSPVALRDSYGKDTNQCVTEYYEDRQVCEKLLDCCPDHVRCAERMNAVSVAYMHAKAKGNQIISNMLKCVQSADPTAAGAISLVTSVRTTTRNAGLPFLRPDAATEDRITRRLSLTSTATIEQRRQRFNRRYNQVRALLAQRIHHISESSRTISHASANQISSERRISIVKNLLKNADDQELAGYISLIADGNFEKLSALEREKLNRMESEDQVDEAMGKMTKIRDAIKAALATKEQKTLNFLETQANQADRLAQKVEEDEWSSEGPLPGLMSKALSEIDSDTLLRAKKFANALGEALQAQKELLLATKEVEKAKEDKEKEIKETEVQNDPSVFHVSGIPAQRTSTKVALGDDREPKAFNELKDKTTAAPQEPEAPAVVQEMPTAAVRPLSQSKMVSIVQPHDGELETVKSTQDAPTTQVLEQLEAEIERKGHKEEEKQPEKEGEVKGEDKRAVEEEVQTEKGEEQVIEEKEQTGEGEKTTTEAVTTEVVEATTTEEGTTVAAEAPATTEAETEATSAAEETTTAEEVSSTTEEATTTEEVTTTTEQETTTTELPATAVPLTEKSKKLMKKIMKDMKKKIEKLRKKVEKLISTTTEAPTTAAPEDRPSVEVEPLTEGVEGSGVEATEEPETTTTTTTVAPSTTQKAKTPAGPSFCGSFANCDEMVRDYHEQCDRRFSPDVINHGIEDAEIVTILRNATISHNDIVLRACLRPLDKASYANLKQLLAIQRGVRRACLELGRNKNLLSEEETAVCTSPLPSTEALDDFLSKTHSRSEETHTLCLAKLAPLRDTCQAVGGCCASINACDNYIASSPVRQLREEAQNVLIKRQHACEDRMLETLSYIQKRLTTRRRRV